MCHLGSRRRSAALRGHDDDAAVGLLGGQARRGSLLSTGGCRLWCPFTGESAVAVAGSTLLVAALFAPLRARVQRAVDRRFNRSRYDAEATVAAFAARLRDAVEIDAIRAELLDAVNQAVQPSQASIWIRQRATD